MAEETEITSEDTETISITTEIKKEITNWLLELLSRLESLSQTILLVISISRI